MYYVIKDPTNNRYINDNGAFINNQSEANKFDDYCEAVESYYRMQLFDSRIIRVKKK